MMTDDDYKNVQARWFEIFFMGREGDSYVYECARGKVLVDADGTPHMTKGSQLVGKRDLQRVAKAHRAIHVDDTSHATYWITP